MKKIIAWLRRIVDVRDDEAVGLGYAFCWFFCILFAYYIVRPVRETMATAVGSEMLGRLFLSVFVVMLLAVPVYSTLVARVKRRRFVHVVVRFFAFWLLGFSFAMQHNSGEPTFWLGCTFFVWVSVFNLFAVSVFWSVLVDLFSSDQGKRLFGVIAAGGSLGGLCSSLLVGRIVEAVGVATLLLIPIAFLELSLFFFRRLETALVSNGSTGFKRDLGEATGGSAWRGMIAALSKPYLLGICVFLLLGKFCATTVYLREIAIVEAAITDIESRTSLFAYENGAVQALTLVFQAVLAGHVMRILGLPATLTLLPLALLGGLLGLALFPTLAVVVGVQILSRSMTFGIAEPAKAVLFTVVRREDKYKSKSFIDTVIFRGGDVAASNLEKLLSFTQANTALVMAPVAATWAVLGWFLGRHQAKLAKKRDLGAQQAPVANQ